MKMFAGGNPCAEAAPGKNPGLEKTIRRTVKITKVVLLAAGKKFFIL